MNISLFVVAATLAAQPMYGIAVAQDGDSLTVAGERVRLVGIDAPEFGQMCTRGSTSWPCGRTAFEFLQTMVTGREVRCIPAGTDDFGRKLARCSTISGVEINKGMVLSGNAVAFRRYSTDYVSAEDAARAAKRGVWSGTFVMPSEVRAVARKTAQPRHIAGRTGPPKSKPAAFFKRLRHQR